MIRNERQYRITRAQVDRFERALAELGSAPAPSPGFHPLLLKAQEDGLRSHLEELTTQLSEYEALRAGQKKVL